MELSLFCKIKSARLSHGLGKTARWKMKKPTRRKNGVKESNNSPSRREDLRNVRQKTPAERATINKALSGRAELFEDPRVAFPDRVALFILEKSKGGRKCRK